jgi:hypothetical protein
MDRRVDVYLLILGGRYGSIEPNSGKSYVVEYEYAVENNKPLFSCVINDWCSGGERDCHYKSDQFIFL